MKFKFLPVLMILITMVNCSDFLDVEPKGVVAPTSVGQLESLLIGNIRYKLSSRSTTMMPDEFTTNQEVYSTFFKIHQNGYRWLQSYEEGDTDLDWEDFYEFIYTANYVLDLIDTADADGETEATRANVKATALSIRAYGYLQLVNVYGPHFNNSTAATKMAVPLLLSADLTLQLPRSSVQTIYDQIESDLLTAIDLFSNNYVAEVRTETTRPGALGLLARMYLYKGQWDEALNYASQTLDAYNTLYNYNDYSKENSDLVKNISSEENVEAILYRNGTSSYSRGDRVLNITRDLKLLFEPTDLRYNFFIEPVSGGNYIYAPANPNNIFPINGIQTPELYLIKAECNARLGNISQAMDDLHQLRVNRFDRAAYSSDTAFENAIELNPSSKEQAIKYVSEERQRELMFTGLRWFDMKRYIELEEYDPTITRTASGQSYSLQKGTDQWVVDIAPYIKAFNPLLN